MSAYAVTLLLIQRENSDTLNIQHLLNRVEAKSEDEAVGLAVKNALARYPKHGLHSQIVRPIAEDWW